MDKRSRLLGVLIAGTILISLLLLSCAPKATPVPGPTPTPTLTPAPTPTARATPAATPTATANPTATPTPVATPTATPTATANPTATPTPVATPTRTPTPAGTPAAITFDPAVAQQARDLFTAKYVCNVCHSISTLNIPGGTLGPDLSAVLLGRVPSNTAPALNPLPRWFEEKGFARPEGDPVKAGELLVDFLASPPDYAPTKQVQVAAFKNTAGGEEPWLRDVKALVELLKEAAAEQ